MVTSIGANVLDEIMLLSTQIAKKYLLNSRLKTSWKFEVLIQHLDQYEKIKVVKACAMEKKASDVCFSSPWACSYL